MRVDLLLVLDFALLVAAMAMYVVDRRRARAGDLHATEFANRWAVLGVIAAAFVVYRLWP